MTAQQLIQHLQDCPQSLEVKLYWDSSPHGDIYEIYTTENSIVLVGEGPTEEEKVLQIYP